MGRSGAASSREKRPRRRGCGKRVRLDTEERRAQLLAAGIEAFSRQPYDAVSMDELARAAGVSKGLLFHYFPSKREYYEATLRDAAQTLLQQTFAASEGAATPPERLQRGLDAYLSYVAAHQLPYTALLRGGIGADPAGAAVVEETRTAFLERLMRDAPEELGAIVQQTPFFRAALRGWLGFVEAASLEWLETRSMSQEELRDFLIRALAMTIELTTSASRSE